MQDLEPQSQTAYDTASAQSLATKANYTTIISDLASDFNRVGEILSNVDAFRRSLMEYGCALRVLESRLRSINDEFALTKVSNPIEHIETRLKTTSSILHKMQRRQIPISVANMEKEIFDIAGLRVICSFVNDVYSLTATLKAQEDLRIIQIKDYIHSPKANGYRSYHMIIEVPFYLSDIKIKKLVEVQFRTIAMDFWASLEHKMRYKKDCPENEDVYHRLRRCAEASAVLDLEMQAIHSKIQTLADDPK